MSGLALRLGQLYPDTNRNWGIRLITLQESVVGASVTRTVWVLWGAVMLVLVMACANVANLLMAKATTRQHEVTVRLALGATRMRIVRQLLTESLLLSCAGGALGAVLAAFGVDFLRSLGVENVPRLDEITVDGRVLTFAAIVAMGSAIAFGLAPALQGFSTALTTTAPRTTHRGRLISVLVSMEVALAMVLLVGAGLMMKSLLALTHVDPGFRTDHMLEVSVALPTGAYPPPKMMQLYRALDEQLATLPGVDASGGVTIAPVIDGNAYTRFIASGRPVRDDEFLMANWRTTTPGFFAAMGIPLLQGRLLTMSEFDPDARVCLINHKAAERFWPGENPLGKIVTPYARKELHYTVVGVVGDIRDVALNTPPDATVYLSGRPWPAMTYLLHTRDEPTALGPAVRERVRTVSPNLPVTIRTLRETLATSLAQPRFSGAMLTIFSWVALLLAMMGIFGVLSFSVAQKTREIGIRVALGAQRADVLRMVLGKGFRLAAIGIAGGLLGAFFGTRVLQSLLYEVRPTDPWIFAAVVVLLGAVALVASYLAARKALRVDPIIALRYE
jgi:predicted permease